MLKSDKAIAAHAAAHALVCAMTNDVKEKVFEEDGWTEAAFLASLLSPTATDVEAVRTRHHLLLFWFHAGSKRDKGCLEEAAFLCAYKVELTEEMETFIGMEPGAFGMVARSPSPLQTPLLNRGRLL